MLVLDPGKGLSAMQLRSGDNTAWDACVSGTGSSPAREPRTQRTGAVCGSIMQVPAIFSTFSAKTRYSGPEPAPQALPIGSRKKPDSHLDPSYSYLPLTIAPKHFSPSRVCLLLRVYRTHLSRPPQS
ncbi:hypothetical protein K458DRAFT_410708 [Lentithecium fluviatile CBS 122367]|uniref:Uncharacterized protein n=1 Tax=Lentithecium fluviatile CBS 122367 TaxID=1168545 RepID=A0A6G1IDE0_9PLEO|nr:hypothetical protein K458DRAFT_410708 [Lentithecium fluviatile CBS 122367]